MADEKPEPTQRGPAPTIGQTRHWYAGHAHWAVVDDDAARIKVAVVGREPSRPLLGFVWMPAWRWGR